MALGNVSDPLEPNCSGSCPTLAEQPPVKAAHTDGPGTDWGLEGGQSANAPHVLRGQSPRQRRIARILGAEMEAAAGFHQVRPSSQGRGDRARGEGALWEPGPRGSGTPGRAGGLLSVAASGPGASRCTRVSRSLRLANSHPQNQSAARIARAPGRGK